METLDINEIVEKGKTDGRDLYRAVNFLHKLGNIIIAILTIAALIFSFYTLTNEGFLGFILIVLISALVISVVYAIHLITTNIAKVLVHTLFSNLAILSTINGEKNESLRKE